MDFALELAAEVPDPSTSLREHICNAKDRQTVQNILPMEFAAEVQA